MVLKSYEGMFGENDEKVKKYWELPDALFVVKREPDGGKDFNDLDKRTIKAF